MSTRGLWMLGAIMLIPLGLAAAANISIVPHWERSDHLQARTEQCGVEVTGHAAPGWVKNNNDHPVHIRSTWLFKGETVRWSRELAPGDRVPDRSGHQVRYYVFMPGEHLESCVIKTTANGPKGAEWKNPLTGNPIE